MLVNTPCVVLRINRNRRVVVEVVALVVESVVAKLVVARAVNTRIVRLPHVHVLAADDGDAPMVAFDGVACNDGVGEAVGVVETNAATSVHGVVLMVVVQNGVPLYSHLNRAYCTDAVAIVSDGAVANDGAGLAEAHEV